MPSQDLEEFEKSIAGKSDKEILSKFEKIMDELLSLPKLESKYFAKFRLLIKALENQEAKKPLILLSNIMAFQFAAENKDLRSVNRLINLTRDEDLDQLVHSQEDRAFKSEEVADFLAIILDGSLGKPRKVVAPKNQEKINAFKNYRETLIESFQQDDPNNAFKHYRESLGFQKTGSKYHDAKNLANIAIADLITNEAAFDKDEPLIDPEDDLSEFPGYAPKEYHDNLTHTFSSPSRLPPAPTTQSSNPILPFPPLAGLETPELNFKNKLEQFYQATREKDLKKMNRLIEETPDLQREQLVHSNNDIAFTQSGNAAIFLAITLGDILGRTKKPIPAPNENKIDFFRKLKYALETKFSANNTTKNLANDVIADLLDDNVQIYGEARDNFEDMIYRLPNLPAETRKNVALTISKIHFPDLDLSQEQEKIVHDAIVDSFFTLESPPPSASNPKIVSPFRALFRNFP